MDVRAVALPDEPDPVVLAVWDVPTWPPLRVALVRLRGWRGGHALLTEEGNRLLDAATCRRLAPEFRLPMGGNESAIVASVEAGYLPALAYGGRYADLRAPAGQSAADWRVE